MPALANNTETGIIHEELYISANITITQATMQMTKAVEKPLFTLKTVTTITLAACAPDSARLLTI